MEDERSCAEPRRFSMFSVFSSCLFPARSTCARVFARGRNKLIRREILCSDREMEHFDGIFLNAVKLLEAGDFHEATVAGGSAYATVGRRDLRKAIPCCALLSKAYFRLDDRLRANMYLSEALSMCKRDPFDTELANAAIFSVMAELYELLGDKAGEEQMLLEYLHRMKRIVGDEHVATSDCYHLLAGFYVRHADLPNAIVSAEKSCNIRVAHGGLENELSAQSLYTLGLIYRLAGNLEKASKAFLDAVAARTACFGPSSLEVAEAQISAGFTAQQTEQVPLASQMYEQAFATRSAVLGPENKATIEAFNLLDFLRHKGVTTPQKNIQKIR